MPHRAQTLSPTEKPREVQRPGGLALTEQALECCGLPRAARVLDAGCGTGAVVERLRSLDYRAVGIDLNARGRHCVRGRIENLPVKTAGCDCVLCECVLSLVPDPEVCLRELHRVLKPAGIAVISDVYDRRDPDALAGLLERCGFSVTLWQDHTRSLLEFAAAAVLLGRRADCGLPPGISSQQAGYCLLLARKDTAHG